MKKVLALITGLMFSLGMSVAAEAYTITYNHDLAGNGNDFISPHTTLPTPAPTVLNLQNYDFDGVIPLGLLTGNFAIVTGLITDHNAPPFGLSVVDSTKYLTVPNVSNVPLTATMNFGQSYDYLGLWWGSIDRYNKLSFIENGNVVKEFIGYELPPPSISNGSQTSNLSNLYVNFYGIGFDAISFTSTNYAFETDNIAVGNVIPEPGTMVLLGFGMLGLAIYGKRRMNKEA